MARYGAVAEEIDDQETAVDQTAARGGILNFFRGSYLGPTLAITVLGLGVGLMTYGFQLWVPTNLQHLGYSALNSDYVVRNAALLGLPLTVLIAWLYSAWGSRRTIVAVSGVTGLALIGFVIAGDSLSHHHVWLALLLVVPLSGSSSVVAVLAGYAAEVYPTLVRSRGTGYAAGMTKAGGVLILALTVAATTVPSIRTTALIGAVPLLLAALVFFWIGPETRQRPLEEITQELTTAQP
jgi:putative MFS transporter